MTRKASSRGIFAFRVCLLFVEDARRSSRSRVFVRNAGFAAVWREFPVAGRAAGLLTAAAFQTARVARRLALAFERQLFERAAAVLSRARFERVGWAGDETHGWHVLLQYYSVGSQCASTPDLTWPNYGASGF